MEDREKLLKVLNCKKCLYLSNYAGYGVLCSFHDTDDKEWLDFDL